MTSAIDIHQHLWPAEFVDRLRARARAPYLRDWRLRTAGEPAYDIEPSDHDINTRIAADHRAGVGQACLSLSAPLGIEGLRRPEATVLIDAWHRGVRELPDHFTAWASVPDDEPDAAALARLLAEDRFVGLQLPATQLATPAAWTRVANLLLVAELADKPVLIHPGPQPARTPLTGQVPGWWAPTVGYVAQMHAAWWAWHAVGGRTLFPQLRLVFAAAAGLAPVHHERHALRGGTGAASIDPNVYVDTSGYGPRALDAVVRVLGIDQVVLGSDRPYAEPISGLLGDAATHALRVANPARLLGDRSVRGEVSWAIAS